MTTAQIILYSIFIMIQVLGFSLNIKDLKYPGLFMAAIFVSIFVIMIAVVFTIDANSRIKREPLKQEKYEVVEYPVYKKIK